MFGYFLGFSNMQAHLSIKPMFIQNTRKAKEYSPNEKLQYRVLHMKYSRNYMRSLIGQSKNEKSTHMLGIEPN